MDFICNYVLSSDSFSGSVPGKVGIPALHHTSNIVFVWVWASWPSVLDTVFYAYDLGLRCHIQLSRPNTVFSALDEKILFRTAVLIL